VRRRILDFFFLPKQAGSPGQVRGMTNCAEQP
jgi:hypothetical protein